MSNGINNPYMTQSDFNLEDLAYHGTAQEILEKDQQGDLGMGDYETVWGTPYGFEGTLADLNLTDEQRDYLLSILPGQGYNYNLASPIMDALGQVFTGGIDIGDFLSEQFIEEQTELGKDESGEMMYDTVYGTGLTDEQMTDIGLDEYSYLVDPNIWSEYYEDAMPTITDMQVSAVPFVDIFDPESIASTLSEMKGQEGAVLASDVNALTTDMIDKTESQYYQPYEFAEREDLVNKLAKAQGKVSTGGFAGSGGRMAGMTAADRLYRGGYEELLGAINKMKAQSLDDVMQTVYGWKELYENLT
tara:strand:+ start:58 stop:966 length:909 start_codon:yes stop_codon:yes gene_type:complete